MKTKRIYLGLILLFAVLFAGCSEETVGPEPGPGPGGGEQQNVQLILKSFDERGVTNRADDEQKADNDEKAITGKVMIFVYDENGDLEYNNNNVTITSTPDKHLTEVFKLTVGDKYFYVFANTDGVDIQAYPKQDAFERQIFDVAITNDIPSIAGKPFLMGTLWKPTPIKIFTKKGNEQNDVTVNIGRLAAKVKLYNVVGDNHAYSNMKGKFEDAMYSIGTIPSKTFLVGQLLLGNGETPSYPPAALHSVVESAVHNEPYFGPGGNIQNPVFKNYTQFIDVEPTIGVPNLTKFFYVTENTTALDEPNHDWQYYGNTTYIRLKTVYTPVVSEISEDDLSGLIDEQTNIPDGTTFYSCIYEGKRYLTLGIPTHPEVTEYTTYEDGVNHHFFPIMDNNQSDDLTIYSVLRNHYYEIEVTGIKDLGAGSDKNTENPEVPIPKSFDVQVAVKVIDWSKVTQKIDI